jgi:hypothetical protein
VSLFQKFLIIDAFAFVVISATCILVGSPEIIVGLIGGYLLAFDTGAAS